MATANGADGWAFLEEESPVVYLARHAMAVRAVESQRDFAKYLANSIVAELSRALK